MTYHLSHNDKCIVCGELPREDVYPTCDDVNCKEIDYLLGAVVEERSKKRRASMVGSIKYRLLQISRARRLLNECKAERAEREAAAEALLSGDLIPTSAPLMFDESHKIDLPRKHVDDIERNEG